MLKLHYVNFWSAMFLGNLFFVFLLASFGFAGSGFSTLDLIVVSVSGIAAVFSAAIYNDWRRAEKIVVEEIGWSPFKLPRKERWKWYRMEQANVTKVLERYAAALDIAIQEEESLFSSTREGSCGQERASLLLQLSGNTREAKKEFWRIHNAFKLFECEVSDSYKDYLGTKDSAKTISLVAQRTSN